ncbi:hypothetical protein SNE40_001730 [Patella caerulea]|uniref:N-sulphoglucosamine sulphohydrolase C-terminal domain-containing protein n=1 Tax=Patella caerulea TaxID=87958 RepID=A0AAN8K6D4_PATCE
MHCAMRESQLFIGSFVFNCTRQFSYSCLTVIGQGKNYKYCQLEDLLNFVEVYDLDKDPHEFDNIVNTADQQLIAILKQELFDLSRCSGIACKSLPLNI